LNAKQNNSKKKFLFSVRKGKNQVGPVTQGPKRFTKPTSRRTVTLRKSSSEMSSTVFMTQDERKSEAQATWLRYTDWVRRFRGGTPEWRAPDCSGKSHPL